MIPQQRVHAPAGLADPKVEPQRGVALPPQRLRSPVIGFIGLCPSGVVRSRRKEAVHGPIVATDSSRRMLCIQPACGPPHAWRRPVERFEGTYQPALERTPP